MFRLVRYFSIASLIGFAIVTAALALFFRTTAISGLVVLGESKNVALTRSFANALWPQFAPFVAEASGLNLQELRNHPQIARLDEAVRTQMSGLSVLKVKVYDLNGLTVFSSETAQIGEDKSNNAGFQAARRGEVATELTRRDTFSAFEGVVEDRDVISSYVPIYGPSGEIEGVFEIYDDVTPLVERINRTEIMVIGGVVGMLALLYVALFFIVRRAERIIHQQNAAIVRSEAQLNAVLNAIGDGILTLEPNGRIVMANREAQRIWGRTLSDLMGASVSTLLDPASWEVLDSVLKQFAQSGDAALLEQVRELTGVRADGSTFPLEMQLAETNVEGQQLFTVAARDITERKRAAEALELRNRQLARVNTFTQATVEHMIEMLQRDAEYAELLTYMRQAQEQFERLGGAA